MTFGKRKQGLGESPSSKRRIEAVEKQRQALELRKAGVGFDVIADKLGYASASGAHAAVMAAMEKTIQEPADELRRMEVERLDTMLLSIWSSIRNGNLGAIDRGLRIQERRAKLLGLDAPSKTALTGNDGGPIEIRNMNDDELLRALAKYSALAEQSEHPDQRSLPDSPAE